MSKRLLSLVLVCLLVLVASVAYAAPKSGDVAAVYKKTNFTPGGKAATIISKLGKDYDKYETPGCHENAEYTYEWSGITLKTYVSKNTVYIGEIEITKKGITTKAGLGVGDSYSKMVKLYGSKYAQDGNDYEYSAGSKRLTITISDEKVTAIYMR